MWIVVIATERYQVTLITYIDSTCCELESIVAHVWTARQTRTSLTQLERLYADRLCRCAFSSRGTDVSANYRSEAHRRVMRVEHFAVCSGASEEVSQFTGTYHL